MDVMVVRHKYIAGNASLESKSFTMFTHFCLRFADDLHD